MVEKMLDLAQVAPQDFVMDLGSGDGRMVIAAAKRGARALGVEYEQKLVELSRKAAEADGVTERATFVQGDMFTADISKATVLALFLLPEHFRKLTPKFLDLPPGSRIVVNTFGIPDWEPDVVQRLESGCEAWCDAKLYVVPARVGGTWQLAGGSLVLQQTFQQVSGTLSTGGRSTPLESAILRGDQISFSVGDQRYAGRVSGDSMEGTVTSAAGTQKFKASRMP
jgi:SAM-dependent methyltransferase